jgi:hypothetical protein
MMNNKSLLGDAMPTGNRRIALNIAMGIALVASLFGALWSIWSKAKIAGMVAFGAFIVLIILGQCWHALNKKPDRVEDVVRKK